jgi:hypothetical protein
MGSRNLSKTAEKSSSSPCAAGVLARQSHQAPRCVTVPVLLLVGIVRVHFLYLNPKICTVICSLINTQSCQFSHNLMLRRMSVVGLIQIPTLVSALNSTIVFLC